MLVLTVWEQRLLAGWLVVLSTVIITVTCNGRLISFPILALAKQTVRLLMAARL